MTYWDEIQRDGKFPFLISDLIQSQGFKLEPPSEDTISLFSTRSAGYLTTTYEITEPGGYKRKEKWAFSCDGDLFTGAPEPSVATIEYVANYVLPKESELDMLVLVTSGSGTVSAYTVSALEPRLRLWNRGYLEGMLEESPEVRRIYGIPPSSAPIFSVEVKTLLERLEMLPSGPKYAAQYQKLCSEIWAFLFCPPLEKPQLEKPVRDRSCRRDIIFPNHQQAEFWGLIRNDYKGRYIVIDSKNYSDPIGRDEANDVANKYLDEKGVGLFGIIISRCEPSPEARDECIKLWRKEQKMILLITDKHLKNMIKRKETGQIPENELLCPVREDVEIYGAPIMLVIRFKQPQSDNLSLFLKFNMLANGTENELLDMIQTFHIGYES